MKLYYRLLMIIFFYFISSMQVVYAEVNKTRLQKAVDQAEQIDQRKVELYNKKSKFEKIILIGKKRLNSDSVKQSGVNKTTKKLKYHIKAIKRIEVIEPDILIPPAKPDNYPTSKQHIETILGRVTDPMIKKQRIYYGYSVINDAPGGGFALNGGTNGISLLVGGQLDAGRIIACGSSLAACLPGFYSLENNTDTLSHSFIRWTTAHLSKEREIPTLIAFNELTTESLNVVNYNMALTVINNIIDKKSEFDPTVHALAIIHYSLLETKNAVDIVSDYVKKGGSVIVIGGNKSKWENVIQKSPAQSFFAQSGFINTKKKKSSSTDFSIDSALSNNFENYYINQINQATNHKGLLQSIFIIPSVAFDSDFWMVKRYNEVKKQLTYPLRVTSEHFENFVLAIIMPNKISLAPNQTKNPAAYKVSNIDIAERFTDAAMMLDFEKADTRYLVNRYGHVKRKALGYWVPAGINVEVTVTSLTESLPDGTTLPLVINVNGDNNVVSSFFKFYSFNNPPVISGSTTLKEGINLISSEFGGLIYVDHLSEDAEQYNIHLSNVYSSPIYVHGTTDFHEWHSSISQSVLQRDPPRLDIVTDNLIITVDTAKVLLLSKSKLEQQLNNYSEGMVELFKFIGLTDEQGPNHLPAGVQHIIEVKEFSSYYPTIARAGFPITFNKGVLDLFVDLDIIFHELGHNYQQMSWIPRQGAESNANLIALAVMDKLNLPLTNITIPYDKVVAKVKNPNFSGWESLSEYDERSVFWLQLSHVYGWDIYTEVFRQTREDQFNNIVNTDSTSNLLIKGSIGINANLAPHFEAYQLKVSTGAKESVRCYLNLVFPISWEITTSLIEIPIFEDSGC